MPCLPVHSTRQRDQTLAVVTFHHRVGVASYGCEAAPTR